MLYEDIPIQMGDMRRVLQLWLVAVSQCRMSMAYIVRPVRFPDRIAHRYRLRQGGSGPGRMRDWSMCDFTLRRPCNCDVCNRFPVDGSRMEMSLRLV